MLYIVMNNGTEICWHIGENLEGRFKGEDVRLVQADCDELDFIARTMTGIPLHRGRVSKWYGDHARFIAGNLMSAWRSVPGLMYQDEQKRFTVSPAEQIKHREEEETERRANADDDDGGT